MNEELLHHQATDTVKALSDTLSHAKPAAEGDWIMHHILNGPMFIGPYQLPDPITKHNFFLIVVALLLVILLTKVAKSYQKSLVPKGLTNFVEVLVLFVRDEIAKPNIGKGYEFFLPYLLTAFFFILFANFLGLIPFTATVTSNIAVTSTLAVLTFIVTQLGGMKKNGVFGYLKGLVPHGLPVALLPLIIPLEFIGLFTKPFALAIRLFANMTAGHIVIYALFSLIFVMKSYGIAVVAIPMALFVYLLEILVALLQAYIFTMLSSLFIGMAVHQEH